MLGLDGLYTFFALADTSIEKLPKWYVKFLEDGPEYLTREFVEKFILTGKYIYADLLESPVLNSYGNEILSFTSLAGNLLMNDSLLVLDNEILLTNGIIHPVDIVYASIDNNYKNWNIYPNPNNGEFFIYTEETDVENLLVKVYNQIGGIVGEQDYGDVNSLRFNFSELPLGIYIVELHNNAFVKYLKIIIAK